MLEFLSEQIFILLGGRVLQQTVASCIGTICVSTLDDLDLYSYEAYFMRGIFKQTKR
jgi:hypothetical protein